jgi:hypothetical protein
MSRQGWVIAGLSTASSAAFAGVNGAVFLSIPTLDEVGIGLLIAIVGGAAGWAVRRRARK